MNLYLLYSLAFLLLICCFYLLKQYIHVQQKIIGKPTYPLVKAFSILLVAFTFQNGFMGVVLPIILEALGYENRPNPYGTLDSIIFYFVVGAIAISYSFFLGKKKDE